MANPAETQNPIAGVKIDAKTGEKQNASTGTQMGNKKEQRKPVNAGELQSFAQSFEQKVAHLVQVLEEKSTKGELHAVAVELKKNIEAVKSLKEQTDLNAEQMKSLNTYLGNIEAGFNSLLAEVPKMQAKQKEAMAKLAEACNNPIAAREIRGSEEPGLFGQAAELSDFAVTYRHIGYVMVGVGAVIGLGVLGDRFDIPVLRSIPIPRFLKKDEEGSMELPNGANKPRIQMPASARA